MLPELKISPNFTIEDIHKIREYNYEMTKNMSKEDRRTYYKNGADEIEREIQKIRENKIINRMNFLKTPFGNIKILINNRETSFVAKKLGKIEYYLDGSVSFEVDERFLLFADVPKTKKFVIKCIIDGSQYDGTNVSSGEHREMTCFYLNNTKISIGALSRGEEDFQNIEYLENGLEVRKYSEWNQKDIVFGVAWKLINNMDIDDYHVNEAAEVPWHYLYRLYPWYKKKLKTYTGN